MSLRVIIVEDEKHSKENLKNLLIEFCEGIEIVGLATSVSDAVTLIKEKKPDVIFLDIELQTGTGFDVLNQVMHLNFDVIFTTAFEQYAIKAVKFSSLDYLLKPIDIEELQEAVEKAKKSKDETVYKKQLKILIQNLEEQKTTLNKICLATSEGFEFLNVSDIIYCKGEGSYTKFTLKEGDSILVSKHLKEYENLLLEQSFMRVHKSYLINLKEVKKFVKSDGGYIVMNNDEAVSIARSKKDDFINVMSVFIS